MTGPNGKKTPPHSLEGLSRLNTVPTCEQHKMKHEHYCLTCEKYLCGACLQKGTHAQNTDHVVRNIQYHYREAREEMEAVEQPVEKRIGEILGTVD